MKKQIILAATVLMMSVSATIAQKKEVIKKGNKEITITKDGDRETKVTVTVDDDNQPQKNDQSESRPNNDRRESREVIISKDGDKETKIMLEINGDEVKINGKPMNEFKEDGVNIRKKKMVIVNGQPLQMEGFGNIDGKDFKFNFNGDDLGLSGMDMDDNDITEEKTDTVAFLGVQTDPASNGVVISSVVVGSAAEKGGLIKDDIITQVNGQPITDPQSLTSAIRALHPNDEVKINYIRGGKEKKAKVVLKEKIIKNQIRKKVIINRNNDFTTPQVFGFAMPNTDHMGDDASSGAFPKKQRLGLKIQDTEEGNGVKVLEVDSESAATKAGLLKDDIIIEIDGDKVNNTDEARILLQINSERAVYKIKAIRNGNPMDFEIKIPRKLKTADL
jgi:serine protease Do